MMGIRLYFGMMRGIIITKQHLPVSVHIAQPVFTLSLHKQHIRLYVKRLGQRLCVDWSNHHKI